MDKIDTSVLNSGESVRLAEKINEIIDHVFAAGKEAAPAAGAPAPAADAPAV